MSYVLDALRRAEKDRSRSPEPSLDNADTPDWTAPPEPQRFSRLPLISLVAACILLSILLLVYSFSRPPAELVVSSTSSQASQSDVQQQLQAQPEPPSISPSPGQALPDENHSENSEVPIRLEADVFRENISASNRVSTVGSRADIADQPSFRQRVESMSFQGGLFNPQDSSKSYVFRGESAFRVGDALEENVYLLDISEDYLVISDGYEEVIYYLD